MPFHAAAAPLPRKHSPRGDKRLSRLGAGGQASWSLDLPLRVEIWGTFGARNDPFQPRAQR